MPCFFYYILIFPFFYNTNLTYRLDNNINTIKYYYLKILLIKLKINVNKILFSKLNININKILFFLLYIIIFLLA